MGQLTHTTAEVEEGVERGMGIGWGVYDDSTYTSGSPLSVASARVQLTIDGLGGATNTDYLPEGVTEFWNTTSNTIVAQRLGDAFDVRLGFKATSSAANSYFDIEFDIGNGSPTIIAGQTKIAPKGIGVETQYTVDIPVYALGTFLSNGCKIYIDTTDSGFTLSIYDITILIKRDYTQEA
jgi:hypothetical protein